MQTSDNKDLFERERLYRGILDINETFRGMEFIQIKESIIIFICTFDPMGRGRSAYIQESYESNYVNYEAKGKLYHVKNKAKTIYLVAPNFAKEKNIKIKNFLSYTMGNKVNGDDFINMLNNTVIDIKTNQIIRSDYVKHMFKEMDIAEKARKDEQAKSKKKELKLKAEVKKQEELKIKAEAEKKELQAITEQKELKNIKFLLNMLTPEQISENLDIPLALIEEVQKEMKNNT